MKGGDRRRQTETQFESHRDIDDDAGKGDEDGDESILLQFFSDRRTDLGTGIHDKLVVGEFLPEDRHDPLGGFFLDGGGRLDPDKKLVDLGELLQFRMGQPVRFQGPPGFVDPDRLFEF